MNSNILPDFPGHTVFPSVIQRRRGLNPVPRECGSDSVDSVSAGVHLVFGAPPHLSDMLSTV